MVPLSLRAKLMLGVTDVMVVSSVPFAIFIRARMDATLGTELSQRGVAIAHELAAQSVDLVLTYNTYQLHDLVHTIQASNKDVSYVFIVDNKGRLLVHTFETGFPEDLWRLEGLGFGEDQRTRLLVTEYGPLLDVAVPIYQGKAGIAHVGMSYQRMGRIINETMGWLLAMGGIGLLIAWVLTYVSVGMILRPIGRLTAAVHEVRRGNMHFRAQVGTKDEIGRFGSAFDTMVEELEQSRIENLRLMQEASRLEAQAQMDRMKSEFLARASHELRTPVAAIQGYVETLARKDMSLNEATQMILFEDMEHISDRLARLVNDLLNVSRIDVGELKPRKRPMALVPAIERAIRRFAVQAPGHILRAEMPARLPPALADPDLLDDILDNLLSNAVKHSAQGTSILVTARLGDGRPGSHADRPMIVLSVKDEGVGIPGAELDKLFQRFYQPSDGASSRGRGIGLGLYLCKIYVEAMGGTIWVESKPGVGSSFSLTVPVAINLPPRRTLARRGKNAGARGAAATL